MPYELNAVNRGVYIADNLHFLKSLNDECIDLVCIDPPFAKNETFGRKNHEDIDPLTPPLTEQERKTERELMARWGIRTTQDVDKAGINLPETAYKDFWSWEKDVHEDWLTSIEQNHQPIKELIEATQYVHSPSTAAYLCYMAVRLFEIKRVLKPTGSLYLHCDHTANGYLRQLLDGIFGADNFRNEIVWKRTNAPTVSKYQFGCVHDTIFAYAKSDAYTINPVYIPYTDAYIKEHYKLADRRGRFQITPLTAQGTRRGSSGHTWRSIDVTAKGLHWVCPTALPEGLTTPSDYYSMTTPEKLDWLEANSLIYWPARGAMPRFKRYLSTSDGTRASDLIVDIAGLQGASTERTGYPTQKPIALAERIIQASSDSGGGVVLDCFAGCAYTAVAAERLGRRWVACDINPRAWTVFKRQFSKAKLALLDCAEPVEKGVLLGNVASVYGPNELPERSSPDHEDMPDTFTLSERKFKVPSSIFSNQEMLEYLLSLSGWQAWCCGFANRRGDGRVIQTTRNFHLDHIEPQSKEGANEIYNRAPLCPFHNTRKGNRLIRLAEYRQEIADNGEMMVDSVNELPHLAEVRETVHRYWAVEYVKRNPQQPLSV